MRFCVSSGSSKRDSTASEGERASSAAIVAVGGNDKLLEVGRPPVATNSNCELERDKCLGSRCLNTDWRPLSQPIRTVGTIEVRIKITLIPVPPVCEQISQKAARLHLLGMSFRQTAQALGVSSPTAVRAARSGQHDQ